MKQDNLEGLARRARTGGTMLPDVFDPAPVSQKRALRPLDDLPGPKPLPIIGNAHQLDLDKLHLTLEGWAVQYGETFQYWLGSRRAIVTSDPALIGEILRERPGTFRREARMARILTELGVRGVFNAEGDSWRAQRKLAVAALAQQHLKRLYPRVRMVAQRLQARWKRAAAAGETLDMVAELRRFTVDVTMLVAFGHDANTLERSDDAIQREAEIVLRGASRRIFSVWPRWRYIPLPADRQLEAAYSRIRTWLSGLIADARARLAAEPWRAENPGDFIEAMLTATDENGEPFSETVIMSNLLTLVIAGEDTTASTLAWAVHELCGQYRWAAEIRREADKVPGADGVPGNLHAVSGLAIAGAVANETMRLRPATPISAFEANVDTTLGPYDLPKGTAVTILSRPAALQSERFVDPLAFRPERWLEKLDGPHDVSAYTPFGAGPRVCPGRSLALTEMKTVLSMLYAAFDVERVGDPAEVEERYGFTMSPAGLKVRLLPRGGTRVPTD